MSPVGCRLERGDAVSLKSAGDETTGMLRAFVPVTASTGYAPARLAGAARAVVRAAG
jgi:hypothetical protein